MRIISAVLAAAVAISARGQPIPVRARSRARGAVRAAVAPQMSYLDNGVVRVGVDLNMGGVITYLSRSSDSTNVINIHDTGREVQQSYYSGPDSLEGSGWPWNPIGAGSGYGDRSTVVASRNDGTTLYVRTIPMQWNLHDEPGECYFETWITLDGQAVRLRYRLTNHRADLTQYTAFDQELPAVYTIGRLYRLFTYDGAAPFTGDPARIVPFQEGPPWVTYYPTENWMAFLDDSGWGLGVLKTDTYRFVAGFAGTPKTGGPSDDATGYIAPVMTEVLDHNIAYTYDASLILGTLDQIRSDAVAHRRTETRPDFHFALDQFQEDRQHFTYANASDSGLPLKGGLHVDLSQSDPQIWLPEGRWDAASLPTLYLTAAFHTHDMAAEVFWAIPGQGFDASRRLDFPVIPDGQMRTYAIPLSSSPAYTGVVTELRLDPSGGGIAGDFIEILSVSFESDTGRSPAVVVRPHGPS